MRFPFGIMCVNPSVMTKAERIKNTLRETKERRKTQRVFVYELKLQNLSKRKIALLERAFLEAKWLYCECGWECDRDVNAALVIMRKGLGLSRNQAVGVGRPELTPLERETAARILGSNPYLRVSFLDEGGSLPERDRRRPRRVAPLFGIGDEP